MTESAFIYFWYVQSFWEAQEPGGVWPVGVNLVAVRADEPFVIVDRRLSEEDATWSVRSEWKGWPICSRLCFRSTFHFIRSARLSINAAVELEGVNPHSSAIILVREGRTKGSTNGLARDDATDEEWDEFGRMKSTAVAVFDKFSTGGCHTCRMRTTGVRGRWKRASKAAWKCPKMTR